MINHPINAINPINPTFKFINHDLPPFKTPKNNDLNGA